MIDWRVGPVPDFPAGTWLLVWYASPDRISGPAIVRRVQTRSWHDGQWHTRLRWLRNNRDASGETWQAWALVPDPVESFDEA